MFTNCNIATLVQNDVCCQTFLLNLEIMPDWIWLSFEVVALQVGVRSVLAASLSATAASERVTDLSLIQATLAQPTLSVPCLNCRRVL